MMTYLTGDNILFSNDAFGQHYASEFMFNDLVDQDELYREAIKYYANILTPFSGFVIKKIEEVLGFKLPVDIIAPSHGIIWRSDPAQIIQTYLKWAADYKEDRITVFYDTMWNGTRRLAEEIVKGIVSQDKKTDVRIFNASNTDKNDLVTEIFRSKAVIAGSPTINRTVLTSIAALLDQVKGLRFKGKKAAAFGCYGWSGESIKVISDDLKEAGFEVVTDGLKAVWNPDDEALKKAFEFGKQLAEKFR
jgi:anaerobic nitric oxide reductase flavorubredoxin